MLQNRCRGVLEVNNINTDCQSNRIETQIRETYWWLNAESIIGSPLLETAGLETKYFIMKGASDGIRHMANTAMFAAHIGTNTR